MLSFLLFVGRFGPWCGLACLASVRSGAPRRRGERDQTGTAATRRGAPGSPRPQGATLNRTRRRRVASGFACGTKRVFGKGKLGLSVFPRRPRTGSVVSGKGKNGLGSDDFGRRGSKVRHRNHAARQTPAPGRSHRQPGSENAAGKTGPRRNTGNETGKDERQTSGTSKKTQRANPTGHEHYNTKRPALSIPKETSVHG